MERCDVFRRLAETLLAEVAPDGRSFGLSVARAFDDDGLEYFEVEAALRPNPDRPWSTVELSRRLNSRLNTAGLGGFAVLRLRPAYETVTA